MVLNWNVFFFQYMVFLNDFLCDWLNMHYFWPFKRYFWPFGVVWLGWDWCDFLVSTFCLLVPFLKGFLCFLWVIVHFELFHGFL